MRHNLKYWNISISRAYWIKEIANLVLAVNHQIMRTKYYHDWNYWSRMCLDAYVDHLKHYFSKKLYFFPAQNLSTSCTQLQRPCRDHGVWSSCTSTTSSPVSSFSHLVLCSCSFQCIDNKCLLNLASLPSIVAINVILLAANYSPDVFALWMKYTGSIWILWSAVLISFIGLAEFHFIF